MLALRDSGTCNMARRNPDGGASVVALVVAGAYSRHVAAPISLLINSEVAWQGCIKGYLTGTSAHSCTI